MTKKELLRTYKRLKEMKLCRNYEMFSEMYMGRSGSYLKGLREEAVKQEIIQTMRDNFREITKYLPEPMKPRLLSILAEIQ